MKKGFTLVELLAVIVILAIIALIATPIVLNIIEESKENSILQSAEFYLDAVEISIVNQLTHNKKIEDGEYSVLENGNICLEYIENECSDELKVEINGQIPKKDSKIVIENSQIVNELSTDITKRTQLNIDDKIVIKNDKGEVMYPACIIANDSTKQGTQIGAKYNCEVKKDEIYTFYVLSNNNDGTTNLVMDQNINSDGTPAGKVGIKKQGNRTYNLISWISKEDYNDDENYREYGNKDKGPITALKFLYEATKYWTNISPMNYIYNDREFNQIPETNTTIGYTSFISTYGVAKLKFLDGDEVEIGTKKEPLRARLPIYSDSYDENKNKISEKGDLSDLTLTKENNFLYLNLEKRSVEPPYGYWTLSSYFEYENYDGVWYADCTGVITSSNASTDGDIGVRPIITIKL